MPDILNIMWDFDPINKRDSGHHGTAILAVFHKLILHKDANPSQIGVLTLPQTISYSKALQKPLCR